MVCKGHVTAGIAADHVALAQVTPILEDVHQNQAHFCMIQSQGELENDVVLFLIKRVQQNLTLLNVEIHN